MGCRGAGFQILRVLLNASLDVGLVAGLGGFAILSFTELGFCRLVQGFEFRDRCVGV